MQLDGGSLSYNLAMSYVDVPLVGHKVKWNLAFLNLCHDLSSPGLFVPLKLDLGYVVIAVSLVRLVI